MYNYLLTNKPFLWTLFVVNIIGTIYGYFWYGSQLAVTPAIFLPFVPDSPTASLFFCIFLAFFIIGRNAPYVEALAIITLFKYGVWAVIMNLLTLYTTGDLVWQGYMLMVSHGAMAVQGLLYAPFYKIKLRHLMVAAIWTLHNDIIDYVFGMMPVYSSLTDYMNEIGYFTFWLSIVSVAIAYYLTVHKKRKRNLYQ
ncbi:MULTISPECIES: DUF1405 domain-containing protein [Sediminibacillus]|uniref:DUF1405 domain-containing protein n=1 Tax=Sediminibacillus TaxID=482460 RepID=UPI0004030903|nr:DUF1405 domain-containing protein [Sediminibacillus terrae]